jgi:protein-S-isoprenylcysteine O-methyltransferase Ste14
MLNMAGYIVFGFLTVWNVVMTIRERRKASELYGHLSLAIFFGTLLFSFFPFSNETFGRVFQGSPVSTEALQITGLSIVLVSIFPYLFALTTLKSRGALEKKSHLETGRLVTSGIYRYVRHPMALAVFILCFGLMLWRLSIASIIAYLVVILFYIVIQRREEETLIGKFGDKYRRYQQRVPALNVIRGLIGSKKQ